MKPIYLDYNATHPPFEDILRKNLEEYLIEYYNPSGASRFSLKRQAVIEDARNYFSKVTKKNKDLIVFCSTGTEANHFLLGALAAQLQFPARVYVSPFEHSSVYGALRSFGIEPILIHPLSNGLIDLNDLQAKLKSTPLPVVCILAANETGVIQPYKEISKLCDSYGVPFYSDLMQAYAKIPVDFSLLDGFTFSSHKIGGGMGASLVCLDEDWIEFEYKLFHGGDQENGRRAGTENSMAIQSFKEASERQFSIMHEKNFKLMQFRNKIEERMKEFGCRVVAENSPRLPSTSFMILPTEDVDFFIMGLEEKGIIISTGSSCKSRSREPSFSLLQMGYSVEEALRAVRISTGYFTQMEDIEKLLEVSESLLKVLS